MAELHISTSSVADTIIGLDAIRDEENSEPSSKKSRFSDWRPSHDRTDLEERLFSILRCTVCLDLPSVAMYQCMNGHLMCAGCHAHLIADSRLRDEAATCPNCRCDIKENCCVRNLAVEKALSELPTECLFCQRKLPRNQIEYHQNTLCNERITGCLYERIGCPWKGPNHELPNHESVCNYPNLPGKELLSMIETIDSKRYSEMALFKNIFELLSFQKIAQSDPQLKPYRTDDFITKLYYESGRFSALGMQWVVKATVNEDSKDPTTISERTINYQLILKSKTNAPMDIHYLVIKGPNSNYKIRPTIYRHEFTNDSCDSPSKRLMVEDSIECNKILSQKIVNLRVLMFQVSKD